jgi:hypothetical protein
MPSGRDWRVVCILGYRNLSFSGDQVSIGLHAEHRMLASVSCSEGCDTPVPLEAPHAFKATCTFACKTGA